MYIPTECMLMHSPPSLIVCGGIGATTPTAGDGTIPTTAGVAIPIMAAGVAGPSAGAASMAAGDGDITTTITMPAAGIPVAADIGAATTGAAEAYIPIVAQAAASTGLQALCAVRLPTEIVYRAPHRAAEPAPLLLLLMEDKPHVAQGLLPGK